MRFACEDELHRASGVVHQSLQSFLVAEQKRAAFVGGETARKTDRQNFRVQNAINLANRLGRFAHSLTTLSLSVANKVYQASFEFLVCVPKLRIGNIDDAATEFRFS